MTTANESAGRALGYGELFWWRIGEAACANASVVVQVDGAIDVERLRRAFEQIARAHPLLRAVVERRGNGRPRFRFVEQPRVALRVLPRTSPDEWHRVVEDDINDSIPHDAQALWRATLLRGDEASDLLITFHHAITDGASAMTVVRELLTAYADRACGAPMPAPSPYDDLLDAGPPWRVLARGASTALATAARRDLARLPTADGARLGTRGRSRILDLSLDATAARRLLDVCKRRGSTMHGLLTSALLLASHEAMDGGPTKNVSLTAAVNVRPLLLGDHSRDVGYYVTGVESVYTVGPETDPWMLSELATESTRAQLTREHVAFALLLRRLVLAVKRRPEDLVDAAPKGSRASLHITNIGRLDLEHDFGELVVRRCFHVPTVHVTGKPFICLASVSFRGALQLTFAYHEPLTARPAVEAIADRFLRCLRSIADESAGIHP